MVRIAYTEDDRDDYNKNKIIKFCDKKENYTIRCEEEEEEEEEEENEEENENDKMKEKYNMNTIRESIEKNPKEKIYLKYYFTDDTYEEIVHNLPNDLLYGIDGVPDSTQLINLIDYVYMAWRRSGAYADNIEFPFRFHFSIINGWVLEKDKIFRQKFDRENKEHIEYRPFFLEFSGYCNQQEIPNLLKIIGDSERKYLSGYFVTEKDDNLINVFREDNDNRVIAVMEGNLIASASPIACIGGKLVIVEDNTKIDHKFVDILNDDIYRCVQKSYIDTNQINCKLMGTAIYDNPKYVDVFNVGQAYCAVIKMESGKDIFSDIGLTKDEIELNTKEIKDAKKRIWGINPQMVILSHWDLDHILGVSNASDSIYNAVWIVPDLWGLQTVTRSGKIDNKLISDSAKRLLKYLDWKNGENLIILDDSLSKRLIYENPTKTMSIWSGERRTVAGENEKKEKYNITKANNFGLMIFLKKRYTALLPGDCEYSVMADDLLQEKINYYVVLHHCSKMSKPSIEVADNKKKAILSYGIHNSYGHPDKLHMKQISDMGYEIIPTVGKVSIRLKL